MKIRKLNCLPAIPKRKRVAAYARVSSCKDAILNSISVQVSCYDNFIQNHMEWQFMGVFADEVVTETKDDCDSFQRLIAECRRGGTSTW